MNTIRHLTRSYERLLKLYPADFHAEFGEEMMDVFTCALQDVSRNGLFALGAVCLRELADFPKNLLHEYASRMGKKFGMKTPLPLLSPKQSASLGALGFGLGFALLILLRALIDPANNMAFTDFPSAWLRETLLFLLVGAISGTLIGAGSRSFLLIKRLMIAGTFGSGLGGCLGTLFLHLYYFGFAGKFIEARQADFPIQWAVSMCIGLLTGAALGLAQGTSWQSIRLSISGAVAFGVSYPIGNVVFGLTRIFWWQTQFPQHWAIPLAFSAMVDGLVAGAILGWAMGWNTDKTATELIEQGDPQ